MVSRINDSRIGVRNIQGRIIQFPSRFGDGGYYNSQHNQAPTTVYFGPGERYFYTLPVGRPKLDSESRAALEQIVNKSLSDEQRAEIDEFTAWQKGATNESPKTQTVAQDGAFRFNRVETIDNVLPYANDTGEGGVVVNNDVQNDSKTGAIPTSLFANILPSKDE